jgi:hypothetical protein
MPPHLGFFLAEMESGSPFAWLVWNCDPPDLCLLSGWDYRQEPLFPAPLGCLSVTHSKTSLFPEQGTLVPKNEELALLSPNRI